jgi:hypothetical protein
VEGVAVDPNECVLSYVTDGGDEIYHYDACTEKQAGGGWGGYGIYEELRVRPTGETVMGQESAVALYGGPAVLGWGFSNGPNSVYPRSVSLDPDGTSAWVLADAEVEGNPYCIFRIDLEAAGRLLTKWQEPCGALAVAPEGAAPGPPGVEAVTPDAGLTSGGTPVTLTGYRFDEASEVTFGDAKATEFTVESSTRITATAPPGSGTADVTVTTPLGTSTPEPGDRFAYVAPGEAPAIRSLIRKRGPAAGGTSLTITGTGFLAVTKVEVGSDAAASFKVTSPTTVTATTAAGTTGPTSVTIVTPNGTSEANSASEFTFEAPTISSTERIDRLQPGRTISIRGSGFALGSGTAFELRGHPATSVDCSSTTHCTAVLPPERSGKGAGVVAMVGTRRSNRSPQFYQ